MESKEREKVIEKEKAKEAVQIKGTPCPQKTVLSRNEEEEETELLGEQNVKLTKQILESTEQQAPATNPPAKISLHRASGDSMGTIGSGSENEDVYVYLCPFPDCDFTTDFQVIIYFLYD